MLVSVIQFVKNNLQSSSDYFPRTRPSETTLEDGKPCKACTDFKSWFKIGMENPETSEKGCPLSRSELGRNTWSFLHTMAAYFPEKPSPDEQKDMNQFLKLFAQFYPCHTCARDFSRLIAREPPRTGSRSELAHWLCWAHNHVNKKLGKPKFDCSTVDERWRTGWKDGSCDH